MTCRDQRQKQQQEHWWDKICSPGSKSIKQGY